jgi:putative transposase
MRRCIQEVVKIVGALNGWSRFNLDELMRSTRYDAKMGRIRMSFPAKVRASHCKSNRLTVAINAPAANHSRTDAVCPVGRNNARSSNGRSIDSNAEMSRRVGAMMMEQSDEWSLNRRYMQLEGRQTLGDTPSTWLSAVAR